MYYVIDIKKNIHIFVGSINNIFLIILIMAHYRVLMVGSKDDVQRIYDTLPDSSSESAAEMAFGFDWIDIDNSPYWPMSTEPFTKENKEVWQEVLDGDFYYCLDARNVNNYGDFGWINISGQMEEIPVGLSYAEENVRHQRNKEKIIEILKSLPNNQTFIFCDSHL